MATPRLDDPLEEAPTAWDRRALLAWSAALVWAAVVWILGSNLFGAGETGGRLASLLTWLFGELADSTLALVHTTVRKCAHVFEYATLALLTLRAGRLAPGFPPLRAAGVAAGLAIALAVADEARQSLLPTRTGSPWDVALDGSGALLAIGLAFALRRTRAARLVTPIVSPRSAPPTTSVRERI